MKKDKAVLFKSKEYGVGGHNKLELSLHGSNDGLRIWIKDGDVNALITMDRRDFRLFAEALTANVGKARVHEEPFDFTKPISHTPSKHSKKVRKPRSDKGVKRGDKKVTQQRSAVDELIGDNLDIDKRKAEAIAEVM